MLWTTEQLKQGLEPEEYEVISRISELRGLGNVPFDADPAREYFRYNVLAFRRSPTEVAASLGRPREEIDEILQRALRKLRKFRQQRLGDHLLVETAVYARTYARLASANAVLFAATGETARRDRAVAHLKHIRRSYLDDEERLMQLPDAYGSPMQTGRAIDYALTALACLDVYGATLDPDWIDWARQLVDQVPERFIRDGQLRECDAAGAVIDIPLSDAVMVFEESSVGLLNAVLNRLSAFIPDAAPGLAEKIGARLRGQSRNPIVHTDSLTGELTRHLSPVIGIGDGFGGGTPAALDELLRAATPRRCTLVPSDPRFATTASLPYGKAMLTIDSGEPLALGSPAALIDWLRAETAPPR